MRGFAEAFIHASVNTPGGPARLADRLRTGCPVAAIGVEHGQPALRFDDAPSKPFSAVIVAVSSRCVDLLGMTLPSADGSRVSAARPRRRFGSFT